METEATTHGDLNTIQATVAELEDPRIARYSEITERIWKISPPIVITIGALGNILTIVVIARSDRLRKATSSVFLIVLAVVDTLILFVGFLRYNIIWTLEYDYRNYSSFTCKIGLFLIYFLAHYEAWILVNLTVERFVAVAFPHKVKQWFNRQTACLALGLTGASCFLLNMHYLWTGKVVSGQCVTEGAEAFYLDHWTRIDLTVASALPFTIMILMNCFIIFKIVANSLTITSSSGAKKTSSMTVILLCVSLSFLIFTLPITVYLLVVKNDFYHTATSLEMAYIDYVWAIVNLMYYLNNSTNFILYCISGQRFRQDFLSLLHCTKRRVGPSDSNVTQTQNDD